MRNKKPLKLFLFLIAFTALFSSPPTYAVQTRGGVACDQWLIDAKTNNWEIVADRFWLLGYLSGLAIGLNTDFLKGTTNDALYAWMDSYCQINNLKTIGEAANVLAKELGQPNEPKMSPKLDLSREQMRP